MSASEKWDGQFRRLQSGDHGGSPAGVAAVLLGLLSVDGGRHVPKAHTADLEQAAYRLAQLPASVPESDRLGRDFAEYEARKWTDLLRPVFEKTGDGPRPVPPGARR